MSARIGLALLLALCSSAQAGPLDLVLNDYGTDYVTATSLDQPRMTAVVFDGNSVIAEANQAVVMEDAFVDTGASAAAVISYLNAVGYTGEWPFDFRVPSLGLDGQPSGEFLGSYTETGIGGQETGDVTRPLGLRLVNQPLGIVTGENYAAYAGQFVDYGQHSLWVRRQVGAGEMLDGLVDPVNIIGMPVIAQRVMVMDPRPLAELALMETRLLAPGDPGIPSTDLSFGVVMRDFNPPLPAGEVRPSVAANPVVPRIGLSHTPEGTGITHQVTDQQWLFDTGAASSFISLQTAWDLGLVPAGMSLETFVPLHQAAGGIVMPVGGIGPAIDVPLVTVDEIRLPAMNTHDVVVWRNVDIVVLDVAGLDGVFGMNLLLPSATFDPADPYGGFVMSPGYFDDIVFGAAGGELRVKVGFELPTIAADFNNDRRVTGRDFLIWQAGYPMAGGALHSDGDADGDGVVSGRDFLIWQSSYQPAPAGSDPVPAPGTLALLLAGLGPVLAHKGTGQNRRRRI